MGYKVNTVWKGKMAFESQLGNHTVRMDVASLLKKMRVPIENFEMDIEAELTDEHPIVFSEIRLKYVFWGDNLDKAKVEKAVKLSQDKYCGVSAMLKKNSPITYTIEYR